MINSQLVVKLGSGSRLCGEVQPRRRILGSTGLIMDQRSRQRCSRLEISHGLRNQMDIKQLAQWALNGSGDGPWGAGRNRAVVIHGYVRVVR